MSFLAILLRCGTDGVEEDARRALKLLTEAASRGDVMAMRNLGSHLHYGANGVERNHVRAANIYL